MNYKIGIDSGGTKIKGSAWNEKSECLLSVSSGPGNIFLNQQRTLENLSTVISQMTLQLEPNSCKQILIGIAGIETKGNATQISNYFTEKFNIKTTVISDAVLALINGLEGKDGILVVAGTGSIVYGKQQQRFYRVGGWGNLLGDQGSAYKIVETFLKLALKDFDYEKNSSSLQTVFKVFNVVTIPEAVQKFYRLNRTEIAGLAIKVAAEAAKEQENAKKAILTQADLLALQAIELAMKLKKLIPLNVALTGSVLQKNDIFRNEFLMKFKKACPQIQPLIMKNDNSRAVIFYN
ncbi:MAG: BadF/BadG/BcrA/BcrD ATPase family protein [Liquorilactobacillus nagelii]|uniref:BadF/BadG/BcrA/BcrD ATPase family protein n=1 Tax=Liquorilactobacillus nagelii TaxID=82688 RepID=UPI0039E77F79